MKPKQNHGPWRRRRPRSEPFEQLRSLTDCIAVWYRHKWCVTVLCGKAGTRGTIGGTRIYFVSAQIGRNVTTNRVVLLRQT